jgi:hypothetical protein
MGATPYSKKVMIAPNTVPWVLNASAKPISKVTYSQAITIKYIFWSL